MSLAAKLASVFCECPLTAELEQARADADHNRDVVVQLNGQILRQEEHHQGDMDEWGEELIKANRRIADQAKIIRDFEQDKDGIGVIRDREREAAATAAKCRAELAVEKDRRYTAENVANTVQTELARVRDELTKVREANKSILKARETAYKDGFEAGKEDAKNAMASKIMDLFT